MEGAWTMVRFEFVWFARTRVVGGMREGACVGSGLEVEAKKTWGRNCSPLTSDACEQG